MIVAALSKSVVFKPVGFSDKSVVSPFWSVNWKASWVKSIDVSPSIFPDNEASASPSLFESNLY